MAQPKFSSVRSAVQPLGEEALVEASPARALWNKTRGRAPRALADLLLSRGIISQDELATALALEQRQDLGLADILLVRGLIAEPQLLELQAEFHNARRIHPRRERADAALAEKLSAASAHRLSALPWRKIGQALVVVTSHPENLPKIREALSHDGVIILALASRADMRQALGAAYGSALARRAESMTPLELSCRAWNGLRTARILACIILGLTISYLLAPTATIIGLYGFAGFLFLTNTGLRLAVLMASMWRGRASKIDGVEAARADIKPHPLWKRPVVSIFVPLFKEQNIAGALIDRLSQIDYPPELLDVMLIIEADDTTTQKAIADCDLPPHFRAIMVPKGQPRTKPRAMNYALTFARGSIIGIYDAEDRPEPDQIWRVVRGFAASPPDLACLQGRLDYYNAGHNFLSRCFTLEYATWFRVMLPGVAHLGLFVPLGGTTVFIRRDVLDEIGGWDAHNVTEDADLGLRLVRRGYRTELIDTTTYEEANSAVIPWIKQRSRWLKGYAMTWATAMRSPTALLQDLGLWRFMGFQVQLIGAVLGFVSMPLLWSFVLKPLGLPHPLDDVLSSGQFLAIGLVFLAAMVLDMAIMIIACEAPHLRKNRRFIPLMGAYFPLATIAAFLAVAEMALRPFYWAKTAHGRFSPSQATAPASSFKRTSKAVER